jgi:3-oxoacyl-[acyl-carrier protein] reductase
MGKLTGRVAIITGASSGVGRGAALRCAEEGATVVGCARRLELLEELVAEIEANGGKGLAVACDVARHADIKHVVATTVEHFGRIDILANIAQGAMAAATHLLDVTTQGALDAFQTGPLQSLQFMQECFPYMKEQGYGRIINTASHTALVGTPGYAAYELAKGATMALTRNASQEWGTYGIVTNTILPVVLSHPDDKSPRALAAVRMKLDGHPLGRIGTPYEDCGPIIAFLASEGAGYLNGQAIAIDGGRGLIA